MNFNLDYEVSKSCSDFSHDDWVTWFFEQVSNEANKYKCVHIKLENYKSKGACIVVWFGNMTYDKIRECYEIPKTKYSYIVNRLAVLEGKYKEGRKAANDKKVLKRNTFHMVDFCIKNDISLEEALSDKQYKFFENWWNMPDFYKSFEERCLMHTICDKKLYKKDALISDAVLANDFFYHGATIAYSYREYTYRKVF